MVSWDAPIFTGNTPLTNYTVSVTNANNNRLVQIPCTLSLTSNGCIVSPTTTSTNITGLLPDSRYNIQIWASNIIGDSGKELASETTDETSKIRVV